MRTARNDSWEVLKLLVYKHGSNVKYDVIKRAIHDYYVDRMRSFKKDEGLEGLTGEFAFDCDAEEDGDGSVYLTWFKKF